MEPIKSFTQLTSHLKELASKEERRKRIAVVWPDDEETLEAVKLALADGFANFIMVGNTPTLASSPLLDQYKGQIEVEEVPDEDAAARRAVELVHQGAADIIMKGTVHTDNLLRAILNKENGLLPRGRVLTHITASEIPAYPHLLFFSDAAVVPYPTLEQREQILGYDLEVCRQFGIKEPKVALIHFTEKVNPKFPNSTDYAEMVARCDRGAYGEAVLAGPIDVKTACDAHAAGVKHIENAVCGRADLLLFPNIESGNVFYKTITLFAGAQTAGMLMGPECPVVVPSRSDSARSKYNSLAMATLCSE